MSIWDDMNREKSARSLAAIPFRRAAGEAGARAVGDAATLSQASGNPFLAQRQGAMAAAQSQAPILAQMAAAQNQAAMRERELMRQEQQANQLRMDRFLGAGLSAGGAGLGMLLQGFGGGGGNPVGASAQGTTSGLPGARTTPTQGAGVWDGTFEGTVRTPWSAERRMNEAHDIGLASGSYQPHASPLENAAHYNLPLPGPPTAGPGGRRNRFDVVVDRDERQWLADHQGHRHFQEEIADRRTPVPAAGVSQLSGMASLIPGYGPLIGAGLNAFFGGEARGPGNQRMDMWDPRMGWR